MHLLRALLYLRLTSVANLVGSRLRRLRQPKYLIGGIAGAAYLWFFFIRGVGFDRGAHKADPLMAMGGGNLEILAAVVLSLFLLLAWVLPGDEGGLRFNEAEVAFLFPAPLSRAQLLHYKLIDGLVMSLLGAFFFMLIAGGARAGWAGAVRYLGAWWLLNANLSLHHSLATFSIGRLAAFGLRAAARRTVAVTAVLLLLGTLGYAAWRLGPDRLAWVLWPARLAVRPFLTIDPAGYVLALLPGLGLLGLQYFAVHRLALPFEEASIAKAQKTGEMVARLRAGKGVRLGGGKLAARREPFPLTPRLPAESALLWKNLMVAPSYLNRKVFLGAVVLAYAGSSWLYRLDDKFAGMLGFASLALLAYLLLIGPQLARNDLRGDLLNADMLKAWPLPGWRVVLGSLLAPTVLLTGIAWVLLFTATVSIVPPAGRIAWLTPELRWAMLGAVTLVLPAFCALQLLVPNGATLLLPAWSQTGAPTGGGGMDVLGQRMIFFLGQVLCMLLALLPAALAGGLTIFATQWLIGTPAAVLLASLPVLVVLGVELWLGVHWIGQRFEALDISAELRP